MSLQDPTISTHQAEPTAVIRESVSLEGLGDFYDRAYTAVGETLGRQGVQPAGAAFGYYLSIPQGTFELEAGFPTAGPVTDEGTVVASELPSGTVARGTHVGAYDSLGDSWAGLLSWAKEQGRTPEGRMWEVYVTQPTPDLDPATLRTDLFLLLED